MSSKIRHHDKRYPVSIKTNQQGSEPVLPSIFGRSRNKALSKAAAYRVGLLAMVGVLAAGCARPVPIATPTVVFERINMSETGVYDPATMVLRTHQTNYNLHLTQNEIMDIQGTKVMPTFVKIELVREYREAKMNYDTYYLVTRGYKTPGGDMVSRAATAAITGKTASAAHVTE